MKSLETTKKLLMQIFVYYDADIRDEGVIFKLNVYAKDLLIYDDYLLQAFDLIRSKFLPKFKGHIPSLPEILEQIKLIKRENDEKFVLLKNPKDEAEQKNDFNNWYNSVKIQFKDNFYFKIIEGLKND